MGWILYEGEAMCSEYDYYEEEPEVEDLAEKLRTIKERVEYILKNYPETRNDDMYLWLIYVRLFDPELSKYIKFIPYNILKKAPKLETIVRVRRKIQNEEHKYLPTDPKVLKRRRLLAETWRKAIVRV